MFEPKDAIIPGHRAPVVRQAEDGERELVELSWGFALFCAEASHQRQR
jgi:hypothetical protein